MTFYFEYAGVSLGYMMSQCSQLRHVHHVDFTLRAPK